MKYFEQAATAFGWARRNPRPGATRDGDWLVGWGCASSAYPAQMTPASTRVTLFPDGKVRVETATHEIGNGIITVVGQTAADLLGVPVENVTVLTGDTNLPPTSVTAGSNTTASVCSAVAQACERIRARLGSQISMLDDLTKTLDARGLGAIEEYSEWLPHGAPSDALQALFKGSVFPIGGARLADRVQYAFGAQFVEVRVHCLTREIRVARVVGAFAGGRVMNERLARSQLMSGMIFGIGSALHEGTELDKATARYVNDNLADYLVPVNADVPEVQVILVPEEDKLVNPLGIKGLGEVGIVGTAAAVANAIFRATGQRLRRLPFRIEDVLIQT